MHASWIWGHVVLYQTLENFIGWVFLIGINNRVNAREREFQCIETLYFLFKNWKKIMNSSRYYIKKN